MSDLTFEWDEAKRLAVLDKYGIDFEDAAQIFEGPVITRGSMRQGGERWMSIGLLKGLEIVVVYVIRADCYRLITARRARENERRAYHETYPDITQREGRPDRLGAPQGL